MNNGVQFINGYQWVDTYYNGLKIAGSQLVDVSGDILIVPNTYNDTAYLRINGKTTETGTGAKLPSNPFALNSVGNFDLVSSGKNLFDITKLTLHPTASVSNNAITINPTATFQSSYLFIPCRSNTAYTLSYTISGTFINAGIYVDLYNDLTKLGNVVTVINNNGNRSFSFNTSSFPTANRIFISVSSGAQTSGTIICSNIQLEQNSIATPHTPFRDMSTVNFPYTLRSLPDGDCDYIEIDHKAKTAKLYINVGEKVFNGTETFSSDYQGTEYFRVYSVLSTMTNATLSSAICSHFPYGGYYQITNENFSTTPFISPVVAFIVKRSTVGATTGNTTAELITLFKSWLADQYNNGTPVTAQYKLATPTVTDLDYEEIKTYYPFTQIYTNAVIQPTLEAKIRTWEA